MKYTERAPVYIKLVEKTIDLLEIPPDSGEWIFLDYDAKTLRLRYLETGVSEP